MLLIRFFFLCCSEFYTCSSGGSITSVISVSGGVDLFAKSFRAGTGVIKNILFTANLIVTGGLGCLLHISGSALDVCCASGCRCPGPCVFLSIMLFIGCHFQGGFGVWEVFRDN